MDFNNAYVLLLFYYNVIFFCREFQEKMRVFAQFNTFKEHEKFFENLQSKKIDM